jgi:hypothetical protein
MTRLLSWVVGNDNNHWFKNVNGIVNDHQDSCWICTFIARETRSSPLPFKLELDALCCITSFSPSVSPACWSLSISIASCSFDRLESKVKWVLWSEKILVRGIIDLLVLQSWRSCHLLLSCALVCWWLWLWRLKWLVPAAQMSSTTPRAWARHRTPECIRAPIAAAWSGKLAWRKEDPRVCVRWRSPGRSIPISMLLDPWFPNADSPTPPATFAVRVLSSTLQNPRISLLLLLLLLCCRSNLPKLSTLSSLA